MEAIAVALITTFGSIIIALMGIVNRNAKKAAKNAEPVSNGFTRHVLDEFAESKKRDEALEKKFDDHLVWSREETQRMWAAILKRSDV